MQERKNAMNSWFEKQISIRLSEDGTSFFSTVKYGRFATFAREIRLVKEGDTPALAEIPDAPIPCHIPLPVRRGHSKP